jgi:ABC-type bacteriocin/lantibiotic exporter with double-glycine peptidase domain
MKPGIILFAATLAGGMMIASVCAGENDEAPPRVPDCGPRCVVYLSRYFDRAITMEQACESCRYAPGDACTSLLQVRKALESLGLSCVAMRRESEDLRKAPFNDCALVVLSDNHYYVIAKAKQVDGWLLMDPVRKKAQVLGDAGLTPGKALTAIAVSDKRILTGGGRSNARWAFPMFLGATILFGAGLVVHMRRQRAFRGSS